MNKVRCTGCRITFSLRAFELHKANCIPKHPGDRFLVGGREFRKKPDRPPDLDAPEIRAVKIVFRWFSSPPAPMLTSDAFYLLEKGKLYRASISSLKEFYIADETELLLEGNEVEALLTKARRAGARL